MNPMRTLHSISFLTIVVVASRITAAAASSSDSPQTLEEATAATSRKRHEFKSRDANSRKPLLATLNLLEPSANEHQTLEEAMAATIKKRHEFKSHDGGSNKKNLGFISRDASSRKPLLAILNQPEPSIHNPQTLEEAMAATNKKRHEFKSHDVGSNKKNLGFISRDASSRKPLLAILNQTEPSVNDPQTLEKAMAARQALRGNNGGRESLSLLSSIEESSYAQSVTIQTRKGTPDNKDETTNGVVPDFEVFEPSFDRRADEIAATESGSFGALCGGASVALWATAVGLFIAQVW